MKKITNENYQSIVYISHPYGGLKANADKIAKVINKLSKQYPDHLFISPIHAFGYAYDIVEYEMGILYCLWLLEKCDEMWVITEDYKDSKGCCIEVDYCQEYNIPYQILKINDIDNTEELNGI